jgi:SAM-dependent methyltransferase
LNVAFAHRHIQAVGIDLSKAMVEYGRAFAKVQKLDNAEILVRDALQPLDFADERFDFVNARFVEGFVKEQQWPVLLNELWRVTAPGGYIRLTEGLHNETNSAACNRILSLIWEGFERDGRATQKDAEGNYMHVGIRLEEFLAAVEISVLGEQTYHLDWSWGTEGHPGMARDVIAAFTLMQPYLVKKVQVVSKEEYEQLLQALDEELHDLEFKGILHFKSVWCQKPV